MSDGERIISLEVKMDRLEEDFRRIKDHIGDLLTFKNKSGVIMENIEKNMSKGFKFNNALTWGVLLAIVADVVSRWFVK